MESFFIMGTFALGTLVLISLTFILFFVILYFSIRKMVKLNKILSDPVKAEKTLKEILDKRASKIEFSNEDIFKQNTFYIKTEGIFSLFKKSRIQKTDLFSPNDSDRPSILIDPLLNINDFQYALPQGLIMLRSKDEFIKIKIKDKTLSLHRGDKEVGRLDFESKTLFFDGKQVGRVEHPDWIFSVNTGLPGLNFDNSQADIYIGERHASHISLSMGGLPGNDPFTGLSQLKPFAEIYSDAFDKDQRAVLIGIIGYFVMNAFLQETKRRRR